MRHLLVVAADAGLEVPKEPLDRVRVGVAFDVDPGGVVDPTMRDEVSVQAVVGGPLIGEDDRLRFDPPDDLPFECWTPAGVKHGRLDPTATFNRGEHGCSTTFAQLRGL